MQLFVALVAGVSAQSHFDGPVGSKQVSELDGDRYMQHGNWSRELQMIEGTFFLHTKLIV